MKLSSLRLALLGFALAATSAAAQQDPASSGEGRTFESASSAVEDLVRQSADALDAFRQSIADEKIDYDRTIASLEAELMEARVEFQTTTRQFESSTSDLLGLQRKVDQRRKDTVLLEGLLGDYVREFGTRLIIAELQRYDDVLQAALLAPGNTNLSEQEVFDAQLVVVSTSLDRLEEALSGTSFPGRAVDSSGRVNEGTFLMVGPAAIFRPGDEGVAGSAEQRLNSDEPAQLDYASPADTAAAVSLVASGKGMFPFDPTLGNAHKVESTKEPFLAHVRKGGAVMVPIFALAGLALLVALFKWLTLVAIPKPSRRQVDGLLQAVGAGDEDAAKGAVSTMRGPLGAMLASGVDHLRQPREFIEEVMYETVLTARLKLQSFLPFIAICAASAPLLGLLGTVTGIISTFEMIELYGAGDVKSLSGGISEALITTKFGLIVAIPSLLLHAFLSHKARRVVDQMEKTAVAFANEVERSTHWSSARSFTRNGSAESAAQGAPPADQEAVEVQVRQILEQLLDPILKEERTSGLARQS